jgi:hypothetical protein
MKLAVLVLGLLCIGNFALSQETPPQEAPFVNGADKDFDSDVSDFDADLDQEINSANGPAVKASELPAVPKEQLTERPTEQPTESEIRQPIIPVAPVIRSNAPETAQVSEPLFVKPEGPVKGGKIRVTHPNAAKGLLRINKDGSYQYRTGIRPKSKSSSLRLGQMTPPKITGGNSAAGTLTYESMYGTGSLFSLVFEYEWQPFTNFGRLGINVGTGFATTRGNGYFKNSRGASDPKADEVYTLYVVPVSLFLTYRFEYARRQKIVPYVNGGGTFYGLVEARDDGKTPNLAGASAVGGGGGVLFSITAWDAAGAFSLDREYGIADMYFSLEARVMQGLDKTIDFSTQTINGGITVDF